jgi:hypothetical protein
LAAKVVPLVGSPEGRGRGSLVSCAVCCSLSAKLGCSCLFGP